jgi:hypothetical protein
LTRFQGPRLAEESFSISNAVKTDADLKLQGFTESGIDRYKKSTTEYCDTLFSKSIALGDRDKAAGLPREVTHDHVKTSAHLIAASYGKAGNSRLCIVCQIGEYVCAATAGVGGGKLDHSWGVVLFGLSLVIGTILFVIRNTNKE